MKRITIPCSAMIAVLLVGCGTFSGRIGFENKCDKPIWIAHVEGFNSEPPGGVLAGGFGKYADMGDMKIPREVVIHWSYQTNHSDCTTKLPIDESMRPAKDDKLVFRFTQKQQWEVSIMR